MIKHYCSSIPLLNAAICVVISNEKRDNLKEYISEVMRVKLSEQVIGCIQDLSTDGFYVPINYNDGSKEHCIVIPEINKHCISVLTHESQHATFKILSERAINHTESTDEVYSYTLAHIVEVAATNMETFKKEVIDDRNKARHRLVSKDNGSGKRRNTRKSNK